jgi:hypothetical protein
VRNRDANLVAKRLTPHIEISREHTLGIRPMRTPRLAEVVTRRGA